MAAEFELRIDDRALLAQLNRVADTAEQVGQSFVDVNEANAAQLKRLAAAYRDVGKREEERLANTRKLRADLDRLAKAEAKTSEERKKLDREIADARIALSRAEAQETAKLAQDRKAQIEALSQAADVANSAEQAQVRELQAVQQDYTQSFFARRKAAKDLYDLLADQSERAIALAEAELEAQQEIRRALEAKGTTSGAAYEEVVRRETAAVVNLNKVQENSARLIGQQDRQVRRFSVSANATRIVAGKLKTAIRAAFIATGVGALLALLASLGEQLSKIRVVTDAVSDAWAAVGAAVQEVVERASRALEGIRAVFSGDVRGGLAQLTSSFDGIGGSIRDAAGAAVQLNQDLRALEDANRNLAVQESERDIRKRELLNVLADERSSIQQQIAAQRELSTIEQGTVEDRLRNAREALRIANAQAEATAGQRRDAKGNIELTNDQADALQTVNRLVAEQKGLAFEAEKAERDLRRTAVQAAKERAQRLADLDAAARAFLKTVQALEDAELKGIDRVRRERLRATEALQEQEDALRKQFEEQGRAFDLEEDFARARAAINRKASAEIRGIIADEEAARRALIREREGFERTAADRKLAAERKRIDQAEELLLLQLQQVRNNGKSEEDFAVEIERRKLDIRIRAARQREKLIRDEFGEFSVEAQLARANIQLLEQEYREAGNIDLSGFDKLKRRILDAIGISEEEAAQLLGLAGDAIGSVTNLINQATQAQIAQQDRLVQRLQQQVEDTRSLLEEERRAQAAGYANNVGLIEEALEREQAALEAAEERKAALQEKAVKRQAKQNQIQAASEYALLVIRLLSSETATKGVVGIGIALAGIALIAKIVAEQKRVAAELTAPGFKDGTPYLEGPGTGTSDSIPIRASRGERILPARDNAELGGRAMSNEELMEYVRAGRLALNAPFSFAPAAGDGLRDYTAAVEASMAAQGARMEAAYQKASEQAAGRVVEAIKAQPLVIPIGGTTRVRQGPGQWTVYREE